MRLILLVLAVFNLGSALQAQSIWQQRSAQGLSLDPGKKWPLHYQLFDLNTHSLQARLQNAPAEWALANSASVLELPDPEGRIERFRVWDSPVMPASLAARYPNIRTWKIESIEHPGTTGRIDLSVQGFNAIVHTPERTWYIQPVKPREANSQYLVYQRKDLPREDGLPLCGTENPKESLENNAKDQLDSRGFGEEVDMRTYVAAIACTGEWAKHHGGTIESAMAGIVTVINQVNSILEKEVSIHLQLVEKNDSLICLNGNTDPFDNGLGLVMIDQNPGWVVSRVPNTSFDIGHVFGTNGSDVGGVAQLASVCGSSKARGVSFQYTWQSSLDPFVSTICHEMGHQYSCPHTFGHCGDSDQLATGTAYEPGSGSTIMGYPGACGSDNVAFESSLYYHTNSIEQIITFTRIGGGNSCPDIAPTGNHEPVIEMPKVSHLSIPISTPFYLTGNAWDSDGDALLYNWEQYDLPELATPLGQPEGNAPIFRSWPPVPSPTRYFPKLSTTVNNQFDITEMLPTYERKLSFRLTVRDGKAGGGGTVYDRVQFAVSGEAGPFVVQTQNETGIEYTAGQWVNVLWDVANTDKAPVNCRKVNIILSTDGGQNFTDTLLRDKLNDGSAYILIPNKLTNQARLQVVAADNIFFDLNNSNFKIKAATAPAYTLALSPQDISVCLPDAANISLATTSILGFDKTVELTVLSGLPDGATAEWDKNPIQPGETANLNISIPDLNVSGVHELLIRAVTEGGDTIYRSATIDFISNRFDDLKQLGPENGALSVVTLPTFEWEPSANAEAYRLEIATDPSFGVFVVYAADSIVGTSHVPTAVIGEKTIYYWRVIPINRCGYYGQAPVSAFQTQILSCESRDNKSSMVISKQGTPVINSLINIPFSGQISDINVPDVKGNHEAFGDLQFRLISPSNDTVLLLKNKCGVSSVNFNMGFDDESPTVFECPANKGYDYKPTETLAKFKGQNPQGDWKLNVTDSQATSGGNLTAWSLRICSAGSAVPMSLLVKEILPCAPSQSALMTNGYLLAEDGVSPINEIVYTLVTVPEHGYITLYGTPLHVGQTFQQAHLADVGALRYHNTNPEVTADKFLFIVSNKQNGWKGIEQFDIVIDIVSKTAEASANPFKVYPNPTQGAFRIEWNKQREAIRKLEICDSRGQVVYTAANDARNIVLPELAAGMYYLRIRTADAQYTEKLMLLK